MFQGDDGSRTLAGQNVYSAEEVEGDGNVARTLRDFLEGGTSEFERWDPITAAAEAAVRRLEASSSSSPPRQTEESFNGEANPPGAHTPPGEIPGVGIRASNAPPDSSLPQPMDANNSEQSTPAALTASVTESSAVLADTDGNPNGGTVKDDKKASSAVDVDMVDAEDADVAGHGGSDTGFERAVGSGSLSTECTGQEAELEVNPEQPVDAETLDVERTVRGAVHEDIILLAAVGPAGEDNPAGEYYR